MSLAIASRGLGMSLAIASRGLGMSLATSAHTHKNMKDRGA